MENPIQYWTQSCFTTEPPFKSSIVQFLIQIDHPTQLHVAKYINATGNGRRQIEALVGPAVLAAPEDDVNDDPVVSLTFSCFGESVGILKEDFWTDVMTRNANRISKAGGIMEEYSSVGLAAAAILFYQVLSLTTIGYFPIPLKCDFRKILT